MSHAQRHIPLEAPLIAGSPHPRCVACVIIPARNEETHITRTLDALRLQRDLQHNTLDSDSFEVILLLNNCTDASETLVRHYAETYPAFRLFIAVRDLPAEQAHVGMARRLLMDTAYERLHGRKDDECVILSTDGDTVVAADWIARNIAAVKAGADAVGGVIHLFPDELERMTTEHPATIASYHRDREFQQKVARLEALLDPDPADPWPRHLEHFGASLACTPAIYALAGGLPPVRPLEDVAFVDALRRVGARIRHCPETHIFTSPRLDGRADVGLSGQLRHWQCDAEQKRPQQVDSAAWLEHRFRTLEILRRLNESLAPGELVQFPLAWRERIHLLHAQRLPTPRFLELLDCNRLIDEMFAPLGKPRSTEIRQSIEELSDRIAACERPALMPV